MDATTAAAIRSGMRRLGAERGLSPVELARLVGLSKQYVYKIESGHRNPTLTLVDRICEVFNVPRSYFLAEAATIHWSQIEAYLRAQGLTAHDVEEIRALVDTKRARRP